MKNSSRSEAGFSLLEVLIATAIMLTVTSAIFTLLNPTGGMFQAQPEVVDMQQRLRIGVDTLSRDLIMAGAGAYSGSQSGSLGNYFAPIMPFVQGWSAQYDDGVGVFKTNRITIFYVPTTASQTTLKLDMADAGSTLTVNGESGCPLVNGVADPLCGFKVGKTLVVYDTTGAFDTFSVTAVGEAGALTLQHTQQGTLSKAYKAGSKIAEIAQHIYFLDTTTQQLMHYDGLSTASPILDNVVGLDFEYYGDPAPPTLRKPGVDQTVTYGPQPPVIGHPNAPWPDGENCTIQVTGGVQGSRLTVLAAGSGLVKLTPAQLSGSDGGPMCPDGANTNRFAANLFRIRKVRVTLRLQTGNASLRGSLQGGQDALFTQAGTGTGARLVGDQQIRFDVSPRNLNLNR